MYKTKNSLPEITRIQVVALLQERLADSIDLAASAKQAHWNVKGNNFIALHKLFDGLEEESRGYMDLIAERIVQLGGTAEGTLQMAAKRSTLLAYPLQATTENEHLHALAHSLATYGEHTINAIHKLSEVRDPATVDIFTEVLRSVDKYLWFLESHIQLEP